VTRFLPTLLVLLSAAAPATARERVAVVSFRFTGELGQALRAPLRASLARGLAAAGFEPLADEELQRRLAAAPELGGCVTAACLRRVGELTGAAYLIEAEVELVGSSNYVISVELLAASTARSLGRSDETCEVCNQSEAGDSLSRAAAALKLPAAPAPASASAAQPAPPPARAPRIAAAAAIATSALSLLCLAVGIPLIAVDGSEQGHHLAADGQTLERDQLHTLGAGGALTAVGAALAGASIVLWVADARAQRAMTPALAPTPTGLALSF
jgi:hypothetical protein